MNPHNEKEHSQRSEEEAKLNKKLKIISHKALEAFTGEWNLHTLALLKRQSISRLLYLDKLYQEMVGVPGVICEFGVQWGATLAVLANLRGIYEPYNHSRKIIGFDTFAGFAAIDTKDGDASKVGDYATEANYEETLAELLNIHEAFSPISHIKKYELIKGNASMTIDPWLAANPSAIVAMAIFDMDVYKPTRDVLEKILPRLTKGSLLVFDELNCPRFPGETTAVNEVLGLNNLKLKHISHQPFCAYTIFGV
jgi:hypothetical protein